MGHQMSPLDFKVQYWPLKDHLGKPSKEKKRIFKDIVLKGGRGSIWKPNYFLVKNEDILVRR